MALELVFAALLIQVNWIEAETYNLRPLLETRRHSVARGGLANFSAGLLSRLDESLLSKLHLYGQFHHRGANSGEHASARATVAQHDH